MFEGVWGVMKAEGEILGSKGGREQGCSKGRWGVKKSGISFDFYKKNEFAFCS